MMKKQPSSGIVLTTYLRPASVLDGVVEDPWSADVHDPERSRRFAGEVRLISRWLTLSRHAALVAAHGTLGGQLPDEEELLHLLHAVEEAIRDRVVNGPSILDELAEWESSLLHYAPSVAPVHCLVCRRAEDLPKALPADYAWALQVVDEHVQRQRHQAALGASR